MDFKSEDLDSQLDVRAVSIVWADDADAPDVIYTGCSHYEAIGLLIAAADLLRAESPMMNAEDDEDE